MVATLLAFGAAEGLARMAGPPPNLGACRGLYQEHPTRDFGLIPGQVVGEYRVNSLGARGAEPEPAERCHRILVLGDSFTFGAAAEADTFHAVLEELIQLRAKDEAGCVEVIGAGVSGYGTRHQRLWFEELGPLLQPDEVVLQFFVGNDFEDSTAPAPELVCGWPQRPGEPPTLLQRTRAWVCRSRLIAWSTLVIGRAAFSTSPGDVPALGAAGFADLHDRCGSSPSSDGCERWVEGSRERDVSVEVDDPAGLYAGAPTASGATPRWLREGSRPECAPLARLAASRGMERLLGSRAGLPSDEYAAATAKGLGILAADLDDPTWAARLSSTRGELDLIAAAVRAAGADLSVLVIPGELQVVSEVRAAAWSIEPTSDLPDPADVDLDWPQRWVADWAAGADVAVIDPTAQLRQASRTTLPYLPYNHHLNPWGDWVVAETLWSWWAAVHPGEIARPGCGPSSPAPAG